MRAWACAIVIAVTVAACGPTVYEQRTARMQALQLDLDVALERWRAEVSLRDSHERRGDARPGVAL